MTGTGTAFVIELLGNEVAALQAENAQLRAALAERDGATVADEGQ